MPSFHDLVGSCTSLLNRHLLCLLNRFASLSCDERPCGSLPAFAWDDIASIGSIPIPPITGWPSLSPHSCTHTSIGVPCGLLPLSGEIWAYHVPSQCLSGMGPPFPPGALMFTTGENAPPVPAPYPFWTKPVSTFALFSVTTFNGCLHLLTLSLHPSS